MTDTQTAAVASATGTTGTLATTMPMEDTSRWPAAAHLSPVAAFQPDRVGICTSYQLAAVDSTVTAGHVEAAVRHLRAAADNIDREDLARLVIALRTAKSEMYRVARGIGYDAVI
ncbi:hypothetical protein [Streptomyces hygroscopicus]|uniref:hypothetical protein n=1 Tax=Streptomyces hygroscopicus TaxID=1912 RepID=UPI0033FF83F8